MKKILLLIAILAMTVSFCVGCGGSADHTHAYTYSFVEGKTPTEEARGEAVGTCSVCGETKTIMLPALTDTVVWSVEEKAATCVEKSAKVYTAKNYPGIKLVIEGEIDPAAHKLADVAAKAATCTEDGNVAYKKCDVCGKIFVDGVEKTLAEVTVKAGHKLADVAAKSATCTEDGNVAYKKCSVCEKIFVDGVEKTLDEVTIKAGHKLVDVAETPASCMKTGVLAHDECSVCHKLFIDGVEKTAEELVIAQLTHDEVIDNAVEATCTKPGKTQGSHCSVCGTVLVEQTTIPAGHNFSNGKCLRCGLATSYGMAIFYAHTENGGSSSGTTYLVLNEKGEATDTLFYADTDLYRNSKVKIELIDEATGRIRITVSYEEKDNTYDDEGWSEVTYTAKTQYYYGYLDKASGIIIIGSSSISDGKDPSFTGIRFMAPIASPDSLTKANFVTCDTRIVAVGDAKPYTYINGGNSYNVFIENGKIYFGVSYADENGNALSAADMKTAPIFYVKNAEGEIIARYGAFNDVIVPLDGLEGVYIVADKTLSLNGAGVVSYGEANGRYELLENGKVAIYIEENDKVVAYYEAELNDDTAMVEKLFVTVTLISDYVMEGGQKVVSVNKNTVYATEVLANTDEMNFVGWTYNDGDKTVVVAGGAEIVVSSDMTLTAVWKELTIITITDSGYDGNEILGNRTIRANIGDILYEILVEKYGVEYKGTLGYFEAKFMIGEDELPESAEIGEDDTEIAVTVVWIKVPDYVGTYYGGELWYAGSSNSGKTLTIDKEGKITGLKTGTVISYDEATQTVTWKDGSKTSKFYFDKDAKIILGIFGGDDIGYDYYFLGQDLGPDGKVVANCGIYDYKPGSTSDIGYYAQFIEAKTALGDNTLVFTYNNVIYSGVTIKNALGETLVVDKTKENSIANATTVLVYKGETLVYSRASAAGYTFKDSTSSTKMTRPLDIYFGTYTCEGEADLTFDGTGAFTWGEKSGTYTLTDEASLTFDLYVVSDDKNTEYHVVMLDTEEKSFVSEMPMVEILFDTSVTPNESLVESVSVNKNIAYTLPVLTAEGHVFRGWLNGDTLLSASVVVTEDLILEAKWDVEYIVTVVYNNGTDQASFAYGEGDKVTVDEPVWKAHKFDGWFTTATFDEGTEWAGNKQAISASVTIYAKWSDAEAYYNNYIPVELTGEAAGIGNKTSFYLRDTAYISIDANGRATCSAYPFSGSISISDYDKETGELTFNVSSSFYRGFIDKTSGIIVLCYQKGASAQFGQVLFLSPFEIKVLSSSISSSYWDNGKTRAIAYTFEGVTYTTFVYNDKVYFGVQFKTALTGGTDVLGVDCYTADTLFVLDSEGNRLFKFAKDGDNGLAEVDEYEGEYTDANYGTVSLNGVNVVSFNGNNGTYSKVEGSEGVFDVYMTEDDITVYYTLTVSLEAGTCELVKPMVTLTFDYNGVTPVEEHSASVSVNKNVEYILPLYITDTQILRGWCISDDESQTLVTSFVPTQDVTCVAQWFEKIALTIVYGNEMEDEVVYFATGTSVKLTDYVPTKTNDKIFAYWYISEDGGVTEQAKYTAETVSKEMTIYCMWYDAFPFVGTFTGFEIWGDKSFGQNKSLTITEAGVVSGAKSGTIQEFFKSKGSFVLISGSSKYNGYCDTETGVIAINYSQTTGLGNDTYFFFAKETGIITVISTVNYDSNKTRFMAVKNNDVEFTVVLRDGKVYSDVTVLMSDIADSEVKRVILKRGVSIVATFGISGAKTVDAVVETDGFEGTYTLAGDEVAFVLDGQGRYTHGEQTGFYTVAGNAVTLIEAGVVYKFDVENKTFAILTDGLEGTYTLAGDDVAFVLDGLGNYTHGTESGTYTVSGTFVKLSNGDSYVVNVNDKVLTVLAANPFEGKVFTGTYLEYGEDTIKLTLTFDTGSQIKGVLKSYETFYFEATFDGTTLTITFTEGSIDSAAVGKTLIGKINGSTITFEKGTYTNNNVRTFYDKGSVTCDGFSL